MHRGRLTTATTMMIMRPNPISRRLLLFGACILFLESHSSGSSSLSPFETQASFNPDDSRLLVKPQVENMHKHKHPPHHQLHPHPHHLQHLKNKNNINQRQNSVGNNESLALLYQDYLGRKQQHLFNSIIINNNNIDKPRKTAPQVPERLPIVVSSSDNSYVSASPIIVEATQSSPPPTTTQSTTTPVVDYRNVNYQQQQRHRPHSRTTSQRNHNHHPSQSRQLSTTNDLSARDERRPRWSLRRLWFLPPQARTPTSNQVDKIQTSSTSDISTTATTTQRNNRPEMIGPERWHQVSIVTSNRRPSNLGPRTLTTNLAQRSVPFEGKFSAKIRESHFEIQNQTGHHHKHTGVHRSWSHFYQLHCCDKLRRLPC